MSQTIKARMKKVFTSSIATAILVLIAIPALAQCDESPAPYNPDIDNDGVIGVTDLLNLFPLFGQPFSAAPCPACISGCTNAEASNYNPAATVDDGSCVFGLQGDQHSCAAANVHNPDLVYGSVTDIDGNTYRTIVIGEQEWMAENLRVAHYANGDLIPYVPETAVWQASGSIGRYCFYNNDSALICPYGYLYGQATVLDARNVCPTGWHVPFANEIDALVDYFGSEQAAGYALKSSGSVQSLDGIWNLPNANATNISGFSMVPNGRRRWVNGEFEGLGDTARLLGGTQTISGNYGVVFTTTLASPFTVGANGDSGSIRCIKND